jgi:hypothetical protein
VVSHHVLMLVHRSPVPGFALRLSKDVSGFILDGTKIVPGLKLG